MDRDRYAEVHGAPKQKEKRKVKPPPPPPPKKARAMAKFKHVLGKHTPIQVQEEPPPTPPPPPPPKQNTKIRLPNKDEEIKHMAEPVAGPVADPDVVAQVKYLLNKVTVKYGIKKQSKDYKFLHYMLDTNLKQYPDLNNKTPKEFTKRLIENFLNQLPSKNFTKYVMYSRRTPTPRKTYDEYKFSEATLQKKQARLERLAQKKAHRDEYMGIDMTDRKAGRARKRAFNLEHGRYNVGRKAARTTRDW